MVFGDGDIGYISPLTSSYLPSSPVIARNSSEVYFLLFSADIQIPPLTDVFYYYYIVLRFFCQAVAVYKHQKFQSMRISLDPSEPFAPIYTVLINSLTIE